MKKLYILQIYRSGEENLLAFRILQITQFKDPEISIMKCKIELLTFVNKILIYVDKYVFIGFSFSASWIPIVLERPETIDFLPRFTEYRGYFEG